MISMDTFICNLKLINLTPIVEGAVVECGTWRGGMIASIGQLLGGKRKFWLFDSFEGLPVVEEIDGEEARQWQNNVQSPNFYDNCTAHESEAAAAMALAGVEQMQIVKGWFEETLPSASFEDGIAILRLDADWYKSTLEILINLFPKVKKGGLIIVDDYYLWEGCSKAVHDYLSSNNRPERIQSYRGLCYLIKEL